jgi:hypothetical protein
MKLDTLAQLGVAVRPFSLQAFEEFLELEAAKKMHDKALKALDRVPNVKPDDLKMLIGARPDCFFALQFVVVGPFPYDASNPRQFGLVNLMYPDVTMTTRQHTSADQWAQPPASTPSMFWRFLEEAQS